jgi:hypothetical protein
MVTPMTPIPDASSALEVSLPLALANPYAAANGPAIQDISRVWYRMVEAWSPERRPRMMTTGDQTVHL